MTRSTDPGPATVRSSVLMAISRILEERGQNADKLLARNGISRHLLNDPYSTVPMANYIAMFEAAAAELGDPRLGARLGMAARAGDMGPVGILLSLSESVAQGLERFTRYTGALQHATDSSYVDLGEEHLFSYRIIDPKSWPRQQDAEFSLVALIQILRSSFSTRLVPLAVQFEHRAPGDVSVLKRVFRCPVEFGHPTNRIILSGAQCRRIYRREDEALILALERHIQTMLGDAPEGPDAPTLSDQVSALISVALGRGAVTLTRVAGHFGMSARTLQRRLGQEGTSFRTLLEQRRHEAADRQLSRPGSKIESVALALGYGDGTAFWRARRRWRGGAG